MREPNRRYFPLVLPSDQQVIGVRNGIMQVEICDEAFLTAMQTSGPLGETAPVLPIGCLRVVKGANLTDFLSFGPHLADCPFLLHQRTRDLLASFTTRLTHVFPVVLPRDARGLNAYALVRVPPVEMDVIDFPRSTFYTGNDLLKNKQLHQFDTPAAFLQSKFWRMRPEHLALSPSFDRRLDLVDLRGVGLYVSERLKHALEQAPSTGIKFAGLQLPVITL